MKGKKSNNDKCTAAEKALAEAEKNASKKGDENIGAEESDMESSAGKAAPEASSVKKKSKTGVKEDDGDDPIEPAIGSLNDEFGKRSS